MADRRGFLILAGGLCLWGGPPSLPKDSVPVQASVPAAKEEAPALHPGEGLAIVGSDGRVRTFGEASREAPMGSLAKLVWLRLEGDEWSSRMVSFRCKGSWEGQSCWKKEGHGRVDLEKALQESCNLAFLVWARNSAREWTRLLGEGAAQARLEDVFGPFLGSRMPQGRGLPPLGTAWVGDGDLLRTSAELFLRWLVDPAQSDLMHQWRRHALGFLEATTHEGAWWTKTGTAPIAGNPGETCAWVAASNGQDTLVLRLPRGRGRYEGLERFRALVGLPPKK